MRRCCRYIFAALLLAVRLVAAGDTLARRLAGCVDRWGPTAETPSPCAPVIDGAALSRELWSALATVF